MSRIKHPSRTVRITRMALERIERAAGPLIWERMCVECRALEKNVSPPYYEHHPACPGLVRLKAVRGIITDGLAETALGRLDKKDRKRKKKGKRAK